ncbi:MAG: VanZ family protein [Tepidanaerobacteraceae bacterium]|nr:VanZ family protein [Tepidanaerobacteraceae bacterium]
MHYILDIEKIGRILLLIFVVIDFIKHGKKNILRRIIYYSFIYYMINVIQLTTGGIFIPPREELRIVTYNFIPFRFVFDWIQKYSSTGFSWFFRRAVILTVYNFIMLFPLGIYLPLLFGVSDIKKVTLYLFLTTLAIETYQVIFSYFGLVMMRTFNVDDLILNTLGGIMGYYVYEALIPRIRRKFRYHSS